MKQSKRLIGLLLAVAMLVSMVPISFANDTAKFSDFPTGWSKAAMTAAVNNGLLNGFEDGKIHPEANVTRAQFAAIISRAFGAKTKANISAYSDVSTQAWYYSDIAKAVKMGALNGKSATQMDPDASITRQEVFTALARILVLSDKDTSSLDKFNDKGEIASWAVNHMAALTERGYVNGDPEGNVNPQAVISREEFAQLMHNAIRTYITKAGTYTDDLDGIVVVRVGDVTLKGLKNSSDLVIGDGAGEGKIFIESVDIEKRLLARGGTIKVSKSTLGDFVVVNNVNGVTKFENYRDEKFFKGIVENTTAKFLTRGGGGTPDIVYTLTLKNEDGSDYCTVTVRNGIVTGYIGDPTKDYYTFDGWYDSGDNKITNFATVTATQELTAKFTPVPYDVTFESEDGVPDFHWTGAYVAPTSFTVEDFTLPASDKVAAPLGYIFAGWSYNGTQIENIEQLKNAGLPTTAGNITIKAEFTLKEYTIEYVGVTWKDEYLPQTTYTIENATLIPLAISEKIANVPAGQEFKYWKIYGTNTLITSIPNVTVDTPDVFRMEPHYGPIPTEPVTVTFYSIYSTALPFSIGEPLSIEKGSTVDKNAFPDPYTAVDKRGVSLLSTGYVEDENIAAVYKDNEYTHTIVPEFWYVKDGVMTPFDETVAVNENTSVYVLSKALSLMLTYEYDGKVNALSVSADYNKDTRVMNSIKDIVAKSGRQQLEHALAEGLIPNYDEMVGKVVDKLESTGLLEVDGNEKKIKNVKVPFKISTFVKEDTANGMIKTYLRDVVKNPAELDKLFTMIDVSELADMLGVETIIKNMTEAEIAALISSSESADFRSGLIEQIIAEMKDKSVASELKTTVLGFIKTQLENPSSQFYPQFVGMIKADLTSDNSVVMDAVVSYIRTNIKATTEEGIALRKEILTSSQLSNFLADEKMKEAVIDTVLKDTFIDKALDNVDYRTILVEAVIDDDDFIDLLLASTEFHDYIIDQLHPVAGDDSAHPLAKDVEDLIQNESSKFRKYVLDLVKGSSAFTGLFTSHPELKDVISAEFEWSDFVASDDDFLKYAFCQSGVTGTYTFVSLDDIDAKIAEKYSGLTDAEKMALTGSVTDWSGLSGSDKQTVRNNLYGNSEAKTAVLNEAKAKLNTYKATVVDKITTGKFNEITDATALKLVDTLLVDYVTKYIEKQRLHTDDAINASIAGVIEEILYGFISDLIHGDVPASDFDHELDDMLDHIDSIKHQFVVDPKPEVVGRLKTVFKNYRNAHLDSVKTVITNNYNDLTAKFADMLDPDDPTSVYSEVESVLINVADKIDAGLISSYIKNIDADDKLNHTDNLGDLIKRYLPSVAVAELNSYIAAFMYNPVTDTENTDNVTAVRSAITEFIAGIDEAFVHTNRAMIEKIITSIDVTKVVNAEFIKTYVGKLDESKGEKTAFADKIYLSLQSNADYTKFMNQLLKGDSVEVNKSNASLAAAISGAIRGLSFESIIGFIDNAGINKLMDVVGTEFVENLYNDMLKDYCDGLDAVITEVKESSDASYKKSYTTSLTLEMNVFTVYDKLYEKAIDKSIEKVENAGIYYNENIYLKFLVEHNVLDYILNGDLSLADGDFSGYSLKAELDYYDYLVMLLLVGDDALTWYGDEVDGLSDEQLDALYNAAFDKIFFVHEKVNEILVAFAEDGTLPAKVQGAISGVSQLNNLILQYGNTGKSLINRYLDSNINIKFEDESIAGEEKILKLVDFIVGNDDPVINIDSVYALLFTFNDKIQSKLEAVVETDKFKAAVEKFESSGFGGMFDGKGQLGTIGDKLDELASKGRIESALDSLYDMFYLLAYEGIDAFKVPDSEIEVTDSEIYRIKVGKVVMEVRRHYR